jgi:protoheme IX farnesyltransferase
MRAYWKLFSELIKLKISLPVAFLGFIGYSLAEKHMSFAALVLSVGVLLLAGAASAINQVIESGHDEKMDRTRRRPIPSGQIGIFQAIVIASLVAFSGMYILWQFNQLALIIGLITFFWYIGVYTMLKRVSAFAVIPGSLTGALPPMIGWVAAGGYVFNPIILYVALFVFIWQVPHFWLLTLLYANDYKKAGFPSLADLFSYEQIKIWTFVWIIFGLLFSLLAIFWVHSLVYLLIHAGSVGLVAFLAYRNLFLSPSPRNFKNLFHIVNSLMVVLLFLQVLFG